MYDKIVNPETNKMVSIHGKVGKKVLSKYFNQSGGSFMLKRKSVRRRSIKKKNQKGGSLRKRSLKRRYKQRGGGNNKFMIFYADWCGYCNDAKEDFKQLQEEINNDTNIDTNVELVDGTENTELAEQYDVMGYPTIVFNKNGNKQQYTGSRTKDSMKEWIVNNL